MVERKLPDVIKEVGFDFSWDKKKVWRLELPAESMPMPELIWHFEVPFLWSKPDGYYDLTPQAVLENPNAYPEEHQRVLEADMSYPIDVMHWNGRWVILDGLHRLMKAHLQGHAEIDVRKVPHEEIPKICK